MTTSFLYQEPESIKDVPDGKSAGEADIVVRLISTKNVATISHIGLVGRDDECHRTVHVWIGKTRVGGACACFVPAGALGI